MSISHEKIIQISRLCGFEIEIVKSQWGGGHDYEKVTGSFTAPKKDMYFRISGKPSRTGTIGRLVNATFDNKYSSTLDKYHIAFDDRKNILKMKSWELVWDEYYEGPTVYNYVAKKPKKQESISPIKNKFGQTFEVDDLVIAIGGSKGYAEIVLGYVTRWTIAGTLFLKPYGPFGSITNQNKGDIRIRDARQTIIVPDGADLEKDLFTIVLGADYK